MFSPASHRAGVVAVAVMAGIVALASAGAIGLTGAEPIIVSGGPHVPPPPPASFATAGADAEQEGGGLGRVVDAAAQEALDELPQQLAGKDEDIGKLAAIRLLEVIAAAGSTERRDLHLAFLKEKLRPASILDGDGDAVSAERIVNALGTWIAAHGAPFAAVEEALRPLVGVGSDALRQGTIRALTAQARRELAAAPGSTPSTVASLREEYFAETLPPDAFVHDAAEIIWSLEPKLLLATLVASLEMHHDAGQEPPLVSPAYVLVAELQLRVPLAFPTPQEWRVWWNEYQGLALDRILAVSMERSQVRSATVWKALLRRLRDTGNAENVLGAIEDTLAETRSTAVRLAAIGALGDLAEWLRGSQVGREGARELSADPTDSLLARGVQLLVSVLRRRAFPLENPQVLQEALGSLQRYQVFLERRPELAKIVSDLAVDVLRDQTTDPRRPVKRQFLLQVVRLVGALRAREAQPRIEGIVSARNASWSDDLELLTAAVTTLGRLQERSLSADVASLLIDHFRRAVVGSEDALREFRRACVTALQLGTRDDEVRAMLRAFYRELLEQPSYKEFRIGATLGLGGLAQLGDREALEDLLSVVARPNLFGHREINAAIDSIAYVGADVVVDSVLPQLLQQQRAVQDHIEKKLVGLIEADGITRLAEIAPQLAALSVVNDTPEPLAAYASLCLEPPVQALLTRDPAGLMERADLIAFWDAQLMLVRAHDAAGAIEPRDALVSQLAAVRSAAEALQTAHPEGVAELAAIRSALAARGAVEKILAEGGNPDAIVQAFRDLVAVERSVLGRHSQLWWVAARLAAPERSAVAGRLADWLASEEADPFWEGFPDGVRARATERIKTLAAREEDGAGQ